MLFGTAHDTLNGHGSGLGYLAPNPTMVGPRTIDIPLACGIDQAGNAWVQINNNYFYDANKLHAYFDNNAGDLPVNEPGFAVAENVILEAFQRVVARLPGVRAYSIGQIFGGGWATLTDVVGELKISGVPFTAYVPPPAPTPPQPILPGPVHIQPIFVEDKQIVSASWTPKNGSWPLTANRFTGNPADAGPPWYSLTGMGMTIDGNLTVSDRIDSTILYQGDTYEIHAVRFYYKNALIWYGFYAVNLSSNAALAVPPGYTITRQIGGPFPIYAANPTFDPKTGMTSFAGVTQFFGITTADRSPNLGLDPIKLSSGLYAIKYRDLGAILGTNGRIYELGLSEIYDTYAQKAVCSFYTTSEGGGGGLLISDPLSLASRIIADISTVGTAEAVRFAAQKAGVPDSTIDLATKAFAAAAIVVATAGTIAVATAPAAGTALTLPVTSEVAAMNAAGSTLLPSSLSLIAPLSVDSVGAAVAGGSIETASMLSTGSETATFVTPEVSSAAVAADPVAAAIAGVAPAAAAPVAGSGLLATIGATIAKPLESILVASAVTAASTELKNLTGQNKPASYAPGQAAAAPAPGAAPAGSGISAPILVTGALAVLAFLKAKK